MENFIRMLLNCKEDEKLSFEIQHVLTFIQPNLWVFCVGLFQ